MAISVVIIFFLYDRWRPLDYWLDYPLGAFRGSFLWVEQGDNFPARRKPRIP
jgi:hypothetical protein